MRARNQSETERTAIFTIYKRDLTEIVKQISLGLGESGVVGQIQTKTK